MKCPKCETDNPSDSKYCKECATPLPSSKEIPVTETLETPKEELTRGTTFAGRYEIIEELGKGGMGKVYRVEDNKIKEEVALKLIRSEIASDKKTIERFSNELKMARKIAHRNVCKMYDLDEEKGAHYITMEYVPGEDLKSMIRMTGQLSVGTTVNIAKQVCQGLTEAHRLGVIHRDLKPQNIMIDKEGNVRIMDFGIARSIKAKGITAAGVMIGTPEYMSPEQVEGKDADQRSDIYSLGVILYEMVTGRVPFEGDTPFAIGMKHKSEIPKNPREINDQIPEDLGRVILRCMEKDKDKRYQSAGEVRSELAAMEKGIPTAERVIPKRKPITSREITVTFGVKKLFIPALVVVALIVAAVVVWRLLPKKEVVPLAPSDKPSLAVMYFENNTGDESLDHWRRALSEWLITDLTQSKHIKVLSGDSLYSVIRKLNLLDAKSYASEDLMKVAAEGRVNHILKGSLSKAGNTFRIDYALQDISTGDAVSSDSVKGEGEESFHTMVDELTKKIKADFKLSEEIIESDVDSAVGKITTISPEAYKYYSEGRKHHTEGQYRQSIQFMRKALEIDPGFAMAYRSLAMSYGNIGYGSEEMKYIQKALELTDRLSERERYLIQGDFYRGSEKTYDKAIEAYDQLLELYPDDLTGNTNSAIIYLDLEEWDKATERYKRAIEAKDPAIQSYIGLCGAYVARRMYDRCKEVLELYLRTVSDNANIHRILAFVYSAQNKYDFALAEVEKASSLRPGYYVNFRMRGHIYAFMGNLNKAEKEYQKLLEVEYPIVQLSGREWLGVLYLLGGRFEESRSQLKQGINLAEQLGQIEEISDFHLGLGYNYLKSGYPEKALEELNKARIGYVELEHLRKQRLVLHQKGLAHIEMESMDEAQRTADELKVMIEKGLNKKHFRYYYHLVGMIELERKNLSKAIEYFKDALSLTPYQYTVFYNAHAIFIDSLASAYYGAGDLDEAKEQYEKIISLTVDRIYFGDIYAKSFYMLGKIYEQQGNTAKAIEHYQKFLELWKDADPGISEVEDARKRLAGLKSH